MSESFLSFQTLKLQQIIGRDDDHLQDTDMGIATPPFPPILPHSKTHQLISPNIKSNPSNHNSMSQDYHQAQQIRRDKLRIQSDYEPPPPALVGIEEEEEESSGLPVYETAGMLSEMFNFPPAGGPAAAVDLLDQPVHSNYRTQPRQQQPVTTNDWYNSNNRQSMVAGGLGIGDSKSNSNRDSLAQHQHQISGINADSAAAMQLFLMNPSQPRSPQSPSPSHHQTPPSTSSTLHMLLPNPSSSLQGYIAVSGGGFGATSVISPPQFTWVPDSSHEGGSTGAPLNNPGEISGVVEGQGLSLSLSSSLQHLEAAKAEELRMGSGGLLYYNQGAGGSSSAQYYKNLGGHQHHQASHLQGGVGQNHHQVHVGFGSSFGVVNVLRNSKYVRAAQELLEEFCSVGRGQFKKSKFGRQNTNPSSNNNPGGGSSSSTKDPLPLSAADRIEHQRKKVDKRYNHYCEQMQMVVNSFDLIMGFGAAVPYTALAQKAMSRHFRCLKEAISAQLKHSCELLGDKDGAGTSAITKGETPRLKLLEQSLRQQRAFNQMGMMEQEAWRPQRGLPERSVNILRAWLFEHFLHPYPSDADKHLLARQTGLSRNQVSNWFINARVRLWKPMVEEMYQQEAKDEEPGAEDRERKPTSSNSNSNSNNNNSGLAQTPTPTTTTTGSSAPAATTTAPTATTMPSGKRSEINANEKDPSLLAINRQCFSENQAKLSTSSSTTIITPTNITSATEVAPQPHAGQSFHDFADDTCRQGSIVTADYGTTSGNANADHNGSTLIRFGTSTAGDVSLTLGLRHAGNVPDKSPTFSVRDFGGC
ncbi:hypothetical protein POTOM_019307 [Populus tomentosa]|uniref:Homeobox domain-containing protein n=1 Tax=Populus tomentosa TaxID=118781 RepID=A0A8X7ZV88_POPTO|nr:hypothetical protein POTOM_019307 [Populus tomentosa]